MSYLKFKKGKQKELLRKALVKAGSERKLSKLLSIPKSSIYYYQLELRNLPFNRAKVITNFLNIDFSKLKNTHIIQVLPKDWGRVKGGVNCVKAKRKDGSFPETVERLKKATSNRMSLWHKNMREKNPQAYYILQYKRFKKISSGYKFRLKNRIKVRNRLEQEVGNFLCMFGIKFDYERYININGKAYFPDFVLGRSIIEVTEWKNPSRTKILYLIKKIKDYRKLGYKTYFFIPKQYRKFYKELGNTIVSELSELKNFIRPCSLDVFETRSNR